MAASARKADVLEGHVAELSARLRQAQADRDQLEKDVEARVQQHLARRVQELEERERAVEAEKAQARAAALLSRSLSRGGRSSGLALELEGLEGLDGGGVFGAVSPRVRAAVVSAAGWVGAGGGDAHGFGDRGGAARLVGVLLTVGRKEVAVLLGATAAQRSCFRHGRFRHQAGAHRRAHVRARARRSQHRGVAPTSGIIAPSAPRGVPVPTQTPKQSRSHVRNPEHL